MKLGLAFVFTLAATAASAQTLNFNLLESSRLIGTMKLHREVLVFQHKTWKHVLFLVVPSAERHGVAGVEPGPGLCIEPGFTLPVWPDTLVIADIDGDDRQELVATEGQVITRVTEFSLAACEPLQWPK